MPSMIRRVDAARYAAVALGFSIPLTIALNNVLLAITLVAWALSPGFRDKLRAFLHPVALISVGLFALTCLGALYGDATMASRMLHVRKYLDLLLIPVFLFLFADARLRALAIHALAVSFAGVLALSYSVKLGLPLDLPSFQGSPEYPVVFKERITHNILMAYATYLYAWLALTSGSRRARVTWASLAALAFFNVFVMVPGATGYLISGALLVFLGYGIYRWRGLLFGAVAVSLVATALVAIPNPFQQRVHRITSELHEWKIDEPARSSPTLRLEFYQTTLSIIADRPVLGVGTGGFAGAYSEKVKSSDRVATSNPHNEFLLIWAQIGIAGLITLIWLFWRQWRLAAQLPTRLERELAYGLVITMAMGCMFNSLLLDHTEGLFYAWATGVLYGGLKSPDSKLDAQLVSGTVQPNR